VHSLPWRVWRLLRKNNAATQAMANQLVANNDAQPTKALYTIWTRELGYGLVAERQISMDRSVVEYSGIIRFVLAEQEEDLTYAVELCTEATGVWVLDAALGGSLGRLVNHSDTPNAVLYLVRRACPRVQVLVFTTRPVAAGEELTINYGLNFHLTPSPVTELLHNLRTEQEQADLEATQKNLNFDLEQVQDELEPTQCMLDVDLELELDELTANQWFEELGI
jgi:SET domain-containing protein